MPLALQSALGLVVLLLLTWSLSENRRAVPWRIVISGDNVSTREEIAAVKSLGKRIRDVRQGPDGWLYLLTDDGKIVRVDR